MRRKKLMLRKRVMAVTTATLIMSQLFGTAVLAQETEEEPKESVTIEYVITANAAESQEVNNTGDGNNVSNNDVNNNDANNNDVNNNDANNNDANNNNVNNNNVNNNDANSSNVNNNDIANKAEGGSNEVSNNATNEADASSNINKVANGAAGNDATDESNETSNSNDKDYITIGKGGIEIVGPGSGGESGSGETDSVVKNENPTTSNDYTKWKADFIQIAETTPGVTCTLENIDGIDTIVYTIGEEVDGTVTINAINDLIKAIDGNYLPAEECPFQIKVVSNSKHTWKYVDNSFILETVDLSDKIESGDSTEVDGAISFDGGKIPKEYSITRTGNTALQALYGVKTSSRIKDNMVTDEALDAKLKEKGYEGGINDLPKYYLDFYNKKYKLNATQLDDFPDKVLREMTSGNRLNYRETVAEISQVGYNWFYNRLLSVIPESERQQYTDEDWQYTIGNIMREGTWEKYCQEAFGDMISEGDEKTLEEMIMYFNFWYTSNGFQGMKVKYNIGFQFEQYDGSLKVQKVDENGEIISDAAEFLIYKLGENGEKLYYTPDGFTSDRELATKLATENGEFSVDYLLPGNTFYLEEITAPDGYVLGGIVSFEILSNNQILLKVTNTKIVTPDPTPEDPNPTPKEETTTTTYVVNEDGTITQVEEVLGEERKEEQEVLGEERDPSIPQTGDNMPVMPIAGAVVSTLVLVGYAVVKKNQKFNVKF